MTTLSSLPIYAAKGVSFGLLVVSPDGRVLLVEDDRTGIKTVSPPSGSLDVTITLPDGTTVCDEDGKPIKFDGKPSSDYKLLIILQKQGVDVSDLICCFKEDGKFLSNNEGPVHKLAEDIVKNDALSTNLIKACKQVWGERYDNFLEFVVNKSKTQDAMFTFFKEIVLRFETFIAATQNGFTLTSEKELVAGAREVGEECLKPEGRELGLIPMIEGTNELITISESKRGGSAQILSVQHVSNDTMDILSQNLDSKVVKGHTETGVVMNQQQVHNLITDLNGLKQDQYTTKQWSGLMASRARLQTVYSYVLHQQPSAVAADGEAKDAHPQAGAGEEKAAKPSTAGMFAPKANSVREAAGVPATTTGLAKDASAADTQDCCSLQ